MSINDTEMMFPASLIPQLGDVRDQEWQEFVDKIVQGQRDVDQIAFVYMIVRLSGCATCTLDAFRAMKGCLLCAKHTIKRYKGSDADLVDYFDHAKSDIVNFIGKDK